jgi:hypothetical protein
VYAYNALPKVFSNAKLLLEGDFTQGLLHTNNGKKFAFLQQPPFRGHVRRYFWVLLTRLFTLEEDDVVESHCVGYTSPMLAARDAIVGACAQQADRAADAPSMAHVAMIVEGLLFDLRGCIEATRKSHSYKVLCRFVLRECLDVLHLAARPEWAAHGHIRNALLRLVAELLENSSKRIDFSSKSTVPLQLVREMAGLMNTVALTLQQTPFNEHDADIYAQRYSSIRSCMETVVSLLTSDYVNLSVMNFYQDPACQLLPVTLDLALSIVPEHVVQFPKLWSILPCLQVFADSHPLMFLDIPQVQWASCLNVLRLAMGAKSPQVCLLCGGSVLGWCSLCASSFFGG